MIIAGCDNGSTVQLPNWRQNLKFAAAWQTSMEQNYPGLARPALCGYRFYNQDVTTGSLLLEVGGHANTLDEAHPRRGVRRPRAGRAVRRGGGTGDKLTEKTLKRLYNLPSLRYNVPIYPLRTGGGMHS